MKKSTIENYILAEESLIKELEKESNDNAYVRALYDNDTYQNLISCHGNTKKIFDMLSDILLMELSYRSADWIVNMFVNVYNDLNRNDNSLIIEDVIKNKEKLSLPYDYETQNNVNINICTTDHVTQNENPLSSNRENVYQCFKTCEEQLAKEILKTLPHNDDKEQDVARDTSAYFRRSQESPNANYECTEVGTMVKLVELAARVARDMEKPRGLKDNYWAKFILKNFLLAYTEKLKKEA